MATVALRYQHACKQRQLEAVRKSRTAANETYYLPSWWWTERQLFIRRFSALQDEMLQLFGLKSGEDRRFLRIEEISEFVEGIAAQEKPVGQPSVLWVPLEREEERVYYRKKVVYDGFEDWVDYCEHEDWPTLEEWAVPQRLTQLARTARIVAKATGCLKEDATAFLLANDTPTYWPLDAEVDAWGGISLHVRHPQVSMRDVTRALTGLQGRAFNWSGLAAKPRHKRATEVFEWVKYWKESFGSLDWQKCYEWFVANQEQGPPYRNMRSFRQAYYTESTRRKDVQREAEALGVSQEPYPPGSTAASLLDL